MAELRQKATDLVRFNGGDVGIVLYEIGSQRTEATRRILTKQILVHLEPGVDMPEPLQREVYDFARFLRVRSEAESFNGLLLSETALAKDWNTPVNPVELLPSRSSRLRVRRLTIRKPRARHGCGR